MPTYHFGQDLLDTYQSMSSLMQLAWLVVPFAFSALMLGIILHHIRVTRIERAGFLPPELEAQYWRNQDIRERMMSGQAPYHPTPHVIWHDFEFDVVTKNLSPPQKPHP